MGRAKLYPGEKILDEDMTAFCGEWYLVNNKPYRSYYGGTIAFLKTQLIANYQEVKGFPLEKVEIKYCNKFARRLS